MPAAISFFDMEVTATPPSGHYKPVPVTLGPNWQPNDVRVLFICAYASSYFGDKATETEVQMTPNPPTGFSPAYSLNPTYETYATFYRYLHAGDTDTSVAFPEPPSWRVFISGTVTARGVNPAVAPVAGLLTMSHVEDATAVTIGSVTVPAAGAMVLCVGTTADPGGASWPAWASATGVPAGWTPLVATDKSGATFFSYDTNPSVNIIGKSYTTSGTTGSIAMPCALGMPAFVGMYMFLQAAPDVSVTVGAA